MEHYLMVLRKLLKAQVLRTVVAILAVDPLAKLSATDKGCHRALEEVCARNVKNNSLHSWGRRRSNAWGSVDGARVEGQCVDQRTC